MTSLPARGEGVAGEAPQDPAKLVEADRSKARRQDPVLVIDRSGIYALIDGKKHRISDRIGLVGIAMRCLAAHMEGA